MMIGTRLWISTSSPFFFLANAAPHHLTLVLAGHLPGVAIYLAYRASYYLTGVVIAVDGGIGELAGTL